MEYKIEKCTEDDKSWLYDLHERTMREYVDKVYGWNPETEREYFEDMTRMRRYHLILDESNEKIGAINFSTEKHAIRIFRIEILPDHQNKGIGSAILRMMINDARNQGKDIELRVLKVNPANRLYLRKGFRMVSESSTHFYMKYECPRTQR